MSALAGLQSFGRNLLRNSRKCLKHFNFICQLQNLKLCWCYVPQVTLYFISLLSVVKKTLWKLLPGFIPKLDKKLTKQKEFRTIRAECLHRWSDVTVGDLTLAFIYFNNIVHEEVDDMLCPELYSDLTWSNLTTNTVTG